MRNLLPKGEGLMTTEEGGAFMLRPQRFPGRVLLSRGAIGHSTIGAEGLNCRVRDGNGCYTLAVATGKPADRREKLAGRTRFPTN